MFRLILFFVLLACISVALTWLADNQGLLQINWLGYKVEASIVTITGFLVATFILAILVVQLLLYIKNTPRRFRQKYSENKYDRTILAITKAVAAIAVSDGKKARQASQELLRLTKKQDKKNQLIAHILSAETAQLEGDLPAARKHFSAMLEHKQTEIVAVKGLLEGAKYQGKTEEALELAESAYRMSPDSKGTSIALLNLYKQAGRWADAELFLDKYKKKKWLNPFVKDELDFDREKAVIFYMRAKQLLESGNDEGAFDLAEKSNKLQPGFIPAVILYADLAKKSDKKRRAAFVIERAWKTNPYPELRDMYFGLFDSDDEQRTVKRAQKLLSLNSHHPEGHRAVALAALKANDYTLARNHTKLAMAEGETESLCKLMVEIGKVSKESEENIRQWVSKVRHSGEDPKWVCKNCGHKSEEWEVKCSNCHSVDSVEWGYIFEGSLLNKKEFVIAE